MNQKGDLQISFTWLFAIVVGASILALSIYGVTKLFSQEQTTIGAKTSKEIGILLNPLETSFESGKTASFTLPAETRIYNECDDFEGFGKQRISISQKSFNQWTETDVSVGFSNKYIFSREYAEGKTFYLFSKPLVFPFKIADLIFLTSSTESYCFDQAPEKIKEEITDINQKNIFPNCTGKENQNRIKICFQVGAKNCDADVNYEDGYVIKRGEKMYFENDAFMYAAIFSDKKIYECQVKRLMQRMAELASIYNDKKTFLSNTGCGSNLDLVGLINSAKSLEESYDLRDLEFNVEDTMDKNEKAGECRLW